MSNELQDHPWLNYVLVAIVTSIVNGLIGKVRKIFTSPDRADFQKLEARLTKQISDLHLNMGRGMQGLAGRIEKLGESVYKRLDEKTDALGTRLDSRIDDIMEGRSGGR